MDNMGKRGPVPRAAFGGGVQPPKGVGEAPIHLSKAGKHYYDSLAEKLADRLEPEDEAVLAECAQAMAEIEMVNASLSKMDDYMVMGSQGPAIHPMVRVRELAYSRFERAAKALGITPADRARLRGALKPAEEEAGGPAAFDADGGHSA